MTDSLFSDRIRLLAPVTMGAACVNCHNSHPESPKHDWKVGDVRGVLQDALDALEQLKPGVAPARG